MTRHMRLPSESGIYHVLLRGINHQPIFEDDEDYGRFLQILAAVGQTCGCTVLAYCLMGNHVHLLVEEGDTPLSQIMHRLGMRYAMWFNSKYARSGHLFQDRFRSEPVGTDAYFVTVLRYIFANPVLAGICGKADEYVWSSRHLTGKHPGGESDGVINLNRLSELCDIDDVLKDEEDIIADKMLDAAPRKDPLRPDAEALARIKALGQVESAVGFQALDRDEQRNVVHRLFAEGFSVRQVSRVSGLSKGLVESWKRIGEKSAAGKPKTGQP